LVVGSRGSWKEVSLKGGLGGPKRIDAVLASIFMDALKGEGVGPARALQSLFWVANAEQYYRRVPYFHWQEYAALSFFEDHVMPVRMHGLWVVTAFLGIYYLLVGLAWVVLIFLLRSQMKGEVKRDVTCVGEESYRDEEDAVEKEKTGARE
jgi:hypothetical protein